ncbi:hypothetical protein [Bradyrhizobium algeriense]|uniref:hypothetical protein n=1 Tax=Bradyrhizobium algeriense TaxID=634784 RepID=UPI00167C54B5
MVGADSVNAYYDPKLKEARIELLKRDPKFPTDAKLVHAAIKEGSSLAASTALSCGNRICASSNAPRQPSPRPRLAEDAIAPNPARPMAPARLRVQHEPTGRADADRR